MVNIILEQTNFYWTNKMTKNFNLSDFEGIYKSFIFVLEFKENSEVDIAIEINYN